jgi:thiosulfate dehydrogenase
MFWPMPWTNLIVVPLAPLLLLLVSCGPEQAVDRGQTLVASPRLSPSPTNVFSCTTCHATQPGEDPEGRRLPGHTLHGAASRPSFWGGGQDYLLDAVNLCYVEFMRGERMSPEDPSGRALLAYLRSISPQADASRPCTVVRDIDARYLTALPPGDANRGRGAYQRACAYCHGAIHTGQGRLGPKVSVLPDETVASFGAQARAIIAEKVRHGKFFGIAGNMPLYCTEMLSDAELSDILSYLLP